MTKKQTTQWKWGRGRRASEELVRRSTLRPSIQETTRPHALWTGRLTHTPVFTLSLPCPLHGIRWRPPSHQLEIKPLHAKWDGDAYSNVEASKSGEGTSCPAEVSLSSEYCHYYRE